MDEKRFYDVIVIGGGPAGLTAAIYLARARYRVLVVEKDTFGGQITITDEVVNYPGVFKTSGKALTESMRKQGEGFGAEYLKAEVTEIVDDGDLKTVKTSSGDYTCFGVLVAAGAHPRMLGFPGEAEFKGHGVAYCATCDGEFFTGKEVFVIGGGFAAAEESVFLTKYASHVTILIRGEDFSCAETVAKAAKEHPKITVLPQTEVVKVSGNDSLLSITYRNKRTGKETTFAPENDTFGVFVFAGYEPASALVRGMVELTEQGYIVTDENQKTSADGIYAAGDICVKNLRQVVTATGDGAVAATSLEKYVVSMQKKTGLVPKKPEAAAQSTLKTETESKEQAQMSGNPNEDANSFFAADVLQQLQTVFSRMESPLMLELHLNEQPVSAELKKYMEELARMTDKLSVQISSDNEAASKVLTEDLPCVRVLRNNGEYTGLAFHGVPGGHEFTSFVLGLYNAAGPGQPIDDKAKSQIAGIKDSIDMKLLVSLSCTMCPELVTAAQRIAADNENVTAEVYDISHYPALRDKYKVMSVPCLVIDKNGEEKVTFGKKNLTQLLEIL